MVFLLFSTFSDFFLYVIEKRMHDRPSILKMSEYILINFGAESLH
jgi:hypothetical protein